MIIINSENGSIIYLLKCPNLSYLYETVRTSVTCIKLFLSSITYMKLISYNVVRWVTYIKLITYVSQHRSMSIIYIKLCISYSYKTDTTSVTYMKPFNSHNYKYLPFSAVTYHLILILSCSFFFLFLYIFY